MYRYEMQNAAHLSTVSNFSTNSNKKAKIAAQFPIPLVRMCANSLSLHARIALHCSSAVHVAARLATHNSLGKVVEEGEAMTTAIDSQQLSRAKLNPASTAAGKANDAVDMNHSSSLSSPIEGFVVQKWMRDRTRAAAPHATAGVSEHGCISLHA